MVSNRSNRFLSKFTMSLCVICLLSFTHHPKIGDPIDQFNGVDVFYNGKNFTHVNGRHTTSDGYNLGLKYQCVEFVKRYYYDVFSHKMPSSYGHAKDYFDHSIGDIGFNKKRGLIQFRNIRESRPQVHDIIVYGPSADNRYGHVAIVSKVGDNDIELIQQNMGTRTRQEINLVSFQQYWTVADYNVLGWLRMPSDKK
jgi:hypothetical protein